VAIADAAGRLLAENVSAKTSQPPEAVSSMDGYAVRAADVLEAGARLKIVGSAPAGHPFSGTFKTGETVRIFTGGVMPDGADSVIIQEDARADGDYVTFNTRAVSGRHIRPAGLDFRRDEPLIAAGRRLTARDVSLLAAADIDDVPVRRRPSVAFAATGDELVRPGEARRKGQTIASSGYGLAALIKRWGAEPRDLGILPDNADAIAGIANAATGADLILTIGGASVGDHDLVQSALGREGFALDFWKIAMRPGKPLIFGKLRATPLIGLPGNPVSTLVCAILFVRPAIEALLGVAANQPLANARAASAIKANDGRQDYLRATCTLHDGELWAEPFAVQDSAMLGTLARADGLIVRKPHDPAVATGERIAVLMLGDC